MNKNRLLLFCAWILGIWLLAACKPSNVVPLPAGSSKSSGEVSLYPDAKMIELSETDKLSFVSDVFGSQYLLYNSSTNVSWVKDTGAKVRTYYDKALPDANWRIESDWIRNAQFYVSTWRQGDQKALVSYLDNLTSDQVNDLKRKYGLSVPESGATLIIIHIWDTTHLLPTATLTETPVPSATPIPSSTPIPSATFTPLPTNTPRPTDTPVPSPTPVNFADEFDTSNINDSVWEVAGPPIGLKDGFISLKSNLGIFPYVYAKQNLIPTQGNFAFEISFRYPAITNRGVGFVLDKTVLPYGANHNAGGAFLSFWQDSSQPLNIRFMGNRIFATPANDILQHAIELRYDGKYDILVDGYLVYSSPATEERPAALWFGNPVNTGGDGAWTSLEVDYIRINSIP